MNKIASESEIISFWNTGFTEPLVSISCLTFNHEKYIRQAIEGFLIQKTNFPFKIFILDDASTDKTAEILKEYEKHYPQLFYCYFLKENTWQKPNRQEIVKPFIKAREKSRYTSLCEGDDYWTDPYKLQKQVDFLESHPDYNLCFTNADKLLPNGELVHNFLEISPQLDYTIEDILKHGNFCGTLTIMVRNNFEIPEWISQCPFGDLPFLSLAAGNKKIHKLPESTAIYRYTTDGIYSALTVIKKMQNHKKTLEVLHKNLYTGKIKKLATKKIQKLNISLFRHSIKHFKIKLLFQTTLSFFRILFS